MSKQKGFFTNIVCAMLISSLLLTVTLTAQVNAKQLDLQNNLEIMSVEIPNALNDFAIKNFVRQVQSIYNEANNYGFNKDEVIYFYLGEPFNCYTYENNNVETGEIFYYPIMFKDRVRGIYAVAKTQDGKYSATLEKGFADQLEKLKENKHNSRIRILATSNCVYAINSEDSVILSNNNGKDVELSSSEVKKINEIINDKKSIINLEKTVRISINPLKLNVKNTNSDVIIRRVIAGPENKYLNVNIVRQSGDTCWAATCAAIINYKKNKSLNDIDVAKYIYGSNWNKGGGINEELKAYHNWGLYPTYYSSAISYSRAVDQLQSGSPIDCGFYAYKNIVQNYGHAMTCRGYVEYENGNKYFSFIDPNKSSYVSLTAYDNTNNITYVFNGKTWYWCESLLGF
ncbi:papain-like cysteine protease family protein [Haloimpatiens lingqiaonensis]|uniref:papain-like cysteine protease family protein n=1 Tax=Haloimpatiens lingqiaonensis TaxID=1380675 RepID=UPI0010FE399A|nr:papain-like cysteine protease family protein [Haloimpatiens lingqiaonensis]